MYPSQDVTDSIGNLIALPLQGQTLKKGNSAFVDENWNAYPEQWEHLLHTSKLTEGEVEQFIAKWQSESCRRNLYGGIKLKTPVTESNSLYGHI